MIDLELSASAIRFSGRPARLCSMNDVTVRRQAEEVLRRYELVVQESRDILLFIRRSDGKILQANPAATRAYGYAHDELLSMTVQDLRAPETRSVVESQMSDADSRGVLFETTHERKDGTTFPAEVSSRGAVIGGVRVLISVVRDITQRKRVELALREANERLRETDERKNEFLAVLSHELRNPLAPIRNGLHVLEQAAPGSEAARRAQEVIARQTRQLARLVDDVLDVVRVSRNKIRLRVTSLDLNELVARTVQDHRSLFEERHITLDATFCAERLAMSGDEARLAQVVGNLLQNAAKFTLPGGHVSVRTLLQAGGSRATLHVVDTGVGIDPATIPQLFEPFMQVETALDRSKGGLGIGLSLVKSLVEMHGGRVRAESDGPDRGAEFVVEFPLEPVATPADVVQGPLAAQRTRRVLIIEDNPDAADTLETMLELGGHVVRVARDGPEGLALAREFRPEVVLCDIGLPGMDGFEVARTFRADAVLSETHLVAVSGYARQEDVQRARDAGFDRHLAKPASPESIQHLLNEHRPSRATRGDMANLH